MAQYPNKVNMPVAASESSKMNLSGKHFTTSNFMDLNVARFVTMAPKQTIELNHRLFARLEPMPVPTFGDGTIHKRYFFVPFRTIFPGFDDMYNDVAHIYPDGVTAHVEGTPQINNKVFVDFFKSQYCLENVVDVDEEGASPDIVIIETTGRPTGINLTQFGSRCLKIFTALGYGIDFNLRNEEITHDALNLLALAKVYADWYYPTAYVQDPNCTEIYKWCQWDVRADYFEDNFNVDSLIRIMQTIQKVNYDSDYFTSAWDNPVAPSNDSYSPILINDTTLLNFNPSNVVTVDDNNGTNGTPTLQRVSADGTTLAKITHFDMVALRQLNDYISRNRIAGARVLDRYLARFGVTLNSDKLKRSYFIGGDNQPLIIGDVTSTASTDGSSLGSFAGKGYSPANNGSEQKFTTDEHGIFLCLYSIVGKIGYYQGADRSTMRKSRLDFFTPEFDNLGVQALATRELLTPYDAREQYASSVNDYTTKQFNYNNHVFGFVPRYAEYKRGIDQITGDYRLRSRRRNGDSWTLMRDVNTFKNMYGYDIETMKHSQQFVSGLDSSQYSRIFYNVLENQDFFNIEHYFDITSYFPAKSMFDTYEFENDDTNNRVNVDLNGVKVN